MCRVEHDVQESGIHLRDQLRGVVRGSDRRGDRVEPNHAASLERVTARREQEFLLVAEFRISDERAVEHQHRIDDGVEHGERLRRTQLGTCGSAIERLGTGTGSRGKQHREDGEKTTVHV